MSGKMDLWGGDPKKTHTLKEKIPSKGILKYYGFDRRSKIAREKPKKYKVL